MDALISVIIPGYNAEKYIRKCLDSVLNQTYKNLQIILVDDGSTDTSPGICDEYATIDGRVQVIHQENKGNSGARNTGIRHSKGDYIGFVDSDDWISPRMYEYLIQLMIENDADISSVEFAKTSGEENGIKEISIKETSIKEENDIHVYNKEEYLKVFFKIDSQKIIYYTWNKLYKKKVVDANSFEEKYSIGEDVVSTYKFILKADKIVSSDRVMYFYRQNSGMTARFNDGFFGLIDVWDRVIELTKKSMKEYLPYAYINRYRINYTLLTELALANKHKESK